MGAPRRHGIQIEGPASAPADTAMILVDTSIWVDHLRADNWQLATLLEAGQVLAHPFATGELAPTRC